MITAERISGKDGREWIKASFKRNDLIDEQMQTINGALRSPVASNEWAIPYWSRPEFERKLGDFLIVWKDEPVTGNGGISEDSIPDNPIVPGYAVFYDGDGKITDSTGFKTSPWGEFQVKGFNLMVSRDFLILADDAGLGKSWQVATAMEARAKLGTVKRGVIVCKASLLYNWRDEIHMHTHQKAIIIQGTRDQRYQRYAELMNSDDWMFLVISYETFRTDVANLNLLDNRKQLDFCVLDEAHKIKNWRSKLGMSIHAIPSFKCRYVLTATPLPNSPLEAYNYLRFGRAMNMNGFDFEAEYAVFGGYGGKEVVGYQNIRELKSIIQTNMLRRRKVDKLKDLPPVTFKTIPVDMTAVQAKMYKAVRDEIREELAYTDVTRIPNALAKLLRLQQVTDSLDIIGAPPSSKNSAKLDVLDEMLEELIEAAGEKVIIFSRFRTMVEIMEERFAKYNPAVIHGDVDSQGKSERSAIAALRKEGHKVDTMTEKELRKLLEAYMASERQKEVYRFQRDDSCKVFLGCAPACREGLTLTAATHVIFLDCEWSPAYVEQAYSRAHRIGQKNNVTVYYLVCVGTIDEKVQKILASKEGMALEMIDNGIDVPAQRAREVIFEMVS
jgi:SNF2 family DNA or RNA helicase